MELLRTGIICYKITFFIADFIAFFSQEVLKNRKKWTSEQTAAKTCFLDIKLIESRQVESYPKGLKHEKAIAGRESKW